MTGYVSLVRRPGAGVPWLAAVLSRVVLGMSVVSIVLLVRRSGAGYDLAGTAAAVMSLGTAVATPVWGRLVDRRGPGRLLLALGPAYAVAAVAVAVAVTRGAPVGVVLVSAALLGAAFPPVSPVARVGWRRLYGLDLRDRAFSLDGVTTEVGFVTGPILAAALVDLVAPWVAVVAAGLVMAVATVMFARAELIRGIVGTRADVGVGALRVPAVRVLMAVFLLVGVAFGTIDILAPAVAEANDRPALAGVMLAAFAFGSATGGLVYGARRWPGARHVRLIVLLVGLMVTMASLTLVLEDLRWFAVVALVGGMVIAPAVVIIFALVDDITPSPVVTEALSWLTTAVTAGAATGSALAGAVVEEVGLAQACLVAVGVLGLGVVVAVGWRRTLAAEPVRG